MKNSDLRIMIINDNPTIHQDIINVLTFSHSSNEFMSNEKQETPVDLKDSLPEFIVEIINHREDALAKIKKSLNEGIQYSLAFIDINVPEDSVGIQTIKQIWEIDPDIQLVICMPHLNYNWEQTVKHFDLQDNYLILRKPFDSVAVIQLAKTLTQKLHLDKKAKQYNQLEPDMIDEQTHSLQHSISLLRSTIESSTNAILVTDLDGNVVYFNKKFIQMWNISESKIQTENEQSILSHMIKQINHTYIAEIDANFFNTDLLLNTKQAVTLKNSSIIECYSQPNKINDTVVGRVRSYHDITEHVMLEKKLSIQALHDALTGLPNRILVFDRVLTAIDRANRNKKEFAVLFIDLDRFKLVNDSLTHSVGDELLKMVANRLSNLIRKEDTLARLGGDEFVMIIPELEKEEYSILITAKILKSFNEPFVISKHTINITTSIGISLYPYDGNNVDDLLRNADLAMYQAKQNGGNQFHFYTNQLNDKTNHRYEVETELNNALINNEFVLVYQPQLDLKNKPLLSIEALIRWNHPTKGLLAPIDFIRIAEDSDLIVPIGEWVIREVCNQLTQWKKKNLPAIKVAINVAIQQLRQPNFTSYVEAILKEYGVDSSCLEFEIKESVLMNQPEILSRLHQFKAMGIKIVLDDFGTGSLSLRHLKSIKIDRLKIDPSFIQNISYSHGDELIIKAIIAISQSANMIVLAEGVESQYQMNFLKKQHCDQIQGFLFSKPLNAPAIERFLRKVIDNKG